jgi:hypothetical protein
MSSPPPKKSSLRRRMRQRIYIYGGELFFTSRRGFRLLGTRNGVTSPEELADYQRVYIAVTVGWWLRSFFSPRQKVDALVVRYPFGRLGNQTFQVNHAITIAQFFGSSLIVAPDNVAIGEGVFPLSPTTRLNTHSKTIAWLTKRDAWAMIKSLVSCSAHVVGTFFENQAFPDNLVNQETRTQSFTSLRKVVPSHKTLTPLPSDHLVIYLRGQDAFGSQRHKSYAQPPFAFYLRVLDHREWKQVTIVSADRINPVTVPLEGELKRRAIPFHFQSGSLDDDLAILHSAQTLVSGRGTFIPAVSGMSHCLSTLYTFVEFDWLRRDVDVFVVDDTVGEYWEKTCLDNWRDAPEQRALMLNYPAENLTLSEARKAQ